ncbi:MAG: TetR/AcrR family transcriptional regulator [Caulobacteraceae bacterium]
MISQPKFRRRSADRPTEIVAAALAVFGDKGFAAARLDDIAKRAGVSKGALYLYYETKEDLFRAVVRQAVAPNVSRMREALAAFPGPFPVFLAMFAQMIAANLGQAPVGPIAKMIIGEGRNFPELARYWHDEVVAPMLAALAGAIERSQAQGEVRPGDPRLYALQMIGPFLMAAIWRETFTPIGAEPIDIEALGRQHLATLQAGMLNPT